MRRKYIMVFVIGFIVPFLVGYDMTSSVDISLKTTTVGETIILAPDNEVTNLTLSGASGSELAAFVGDVSVGGDVTVVGSVAGDGTDVLGAFLKTVYNDVNGRTLSGVDSDTCQTNLNGSAPGAWVLPTAAAGLEYTFLLLAAQELRVTPAAGDNINYGGTAMAAQEYYYADAVGETLHIIAADDTQWFVISSTGTWSEETP